MKACTLLISLSLVMTISAEPLKVGEKIPGVELKTALNKSVKLDSEARAHPLVIIFYRGGWCPYCNQHLAALHEIGPQLKALGYRTLAISPDRPEKLLAGSGQARESCTLLSDSSMAAAKAFGLAFEVDAPMLEKLESYNIDIEEASGQRHHLLPVPAVFITSRDGTIQFAHSNPDYTVRLSPSRILEAAQAAVHTSDLNGFDISNASIPVKEIVSGGPPRDGIPAIDKPKFTDPAGIDFLKADDEVVSVTVGTETRAYPLRILVYHEIVNDEINGRPFAITYCPLCGTAMVFSRKVGARTVDFGVSGLLHNSDVLMYDRQTESLWSQLAMEAVAGPLLGKTLMWLPSEQLTWAAWQKKYPKGRVLSTDTGFIRDYSREVYAGYSKSPETMFPVPEHRNELAKKDWVIGVSVDGMARAYPLKALEARGSLTDDTLEVTYDSKTRQATVKRKAAGEVLPSVKVYWFAWQAFYPETQLWIAPSGNE